MDQRTVSLEYDRERVDNYRRVLADVYLDDGSMLNQRLIETGYSPAVLGFPIRSDRRRLFEEVEQVAQAGVLGIWTLPEWQDRLREQRERRDRSRR